MGEACSTHWGDEKYIYTLLVGKSGGSDHLEDLGVDGKVML
jgi:hypothetical protein